MQKGSWVKIKYGANKGSVGKITSHKVNDDYVVALEDGTWLSLDSKAVEVIKPYEISQAELKKIVRGELSYEEISSDVFPPFNIKAEKKYKMKAEDIKCAIKNINKNKEPLEPFKKWFWLILNVFYEDLYLDELYDEKIFDDFPKTEKEIFSTVFNITEKLYWKLEERFGFKEDEEQYFVKFENEPKWDINETEKGMLEESAYFGVCSEIVDRVESYNYNKGLPQGAWIYSKSQMKHVLSTYKNPDEIKKATPESKALIKKFVKDLYAAGDLQATKILGYSHFEGGALFRQNWDLSKKYLLEAFEKQGDPYVATALGFIEYFGKGNGKEPDYEKAFSYFSYAALDGIEEAILRTGDMLIHGRGVKKNVDMGLSMIADGYKASLEEFCSGRYDNKFAEYAILMGNSCKEKLIYDMGKRDEYRFYLEAQYALKLRKPRRFYGDESLSADVEKELEKIRDEIGIDASRDTLRADFPIFINQIYNEKYPAVVTIDKTKSGYKLRLRRANLANVLNFDALEKVIGKEAKEFKKSFESKILVTYPELSYSKLVSELEFILEDVSIVEVKSNSKTFISDGFKKNEVTGALEFYSEGKLAAAIDARWYTIKVKK